MSELIINIVQNTTNSYKFILSSDGIAIDHTAITRARFHNNGLDYCDSNSFASIWDFTNTGFITVKLGLGNLPVGLTQARLIVSDNVNILGLAWDTLLHLNVKN